MPSILFLSDPSVPASNDNHRTLPAAFSHAGWLVETATPALAWIDGSVVSGHFRLRDFDLIWPLGLGRRADFIDRMQLLAHSGARLINPPAAYLLLHGKLMWADLMPLTHASADPDVLAARLHDRSRWVLKPAAGSFGRGIVRLGASDELILRQTMCASPGTWYLLQEDIPDIARGEHRTLIAGGRIIGSYRREAGPHGLSNLAAGGVARIGQPTGAEAEIVANVMQRLVARSAGFSAVDTSGSHLVEVNIANPGGLGTLDRLYGRDFGPAVVEAVEAWCAR